MTPTARLAVTLRVYRAIHRLTQAELAEKMREVGCPWSPTTVSNIECRARYVTVDEMFALASVLNKTLDQLFEAP